MRLVRIALAVLVVSAAVGCTPTDNDSRSETQGLPDVPQRLMASEWRLDPAASSPAIASTATTLVFESEHVVTGQAPCNTYRGRVDVSDSEVRFTRLLATERPCDASTTAAEGAYFAALETVRDSDTTDADRLVLTGDDGVELSYVAQTRRADLIGAWRIVGVERDGELVRVVPGSDPVGTFVRDGSLVVDSGCNQLNSSWTLDGPSIAIDEPRSTRKACEEPPGVMEQEAALSSALTSAAVADLAGSELRLFDDDGSVVLVGRH